MSALRERIVAQFRKPTGVLGRIAGMVMAARPSNRKRNLWTLDLLDIQETDHIFEFGCGPGFALQIAATRARHGFVTGVDHSPAMIAMARRRLRGALKEGRANLIIGDDGQLAAYEGALNAVYSANVVQFLDDKERYFRRAYAALKAEGRMATTYQPRGAKPNAAQSDRMAELCEETARAAGFYTVNIHRLDLAGAPAICVLSVK